MKLLVLIDGSNKSTRAVMHAIGFAKSCKEPVEVHLLNVQLPITFGDIGKFVSQEALLAHYNKEAMAILSKPRDLLTSEGIPHTVQIRVGPIAESIDKYLSESACDQIIMGTRGLGAVQSLLLGSVAMKVIHMVKVPVTLIK